MQTIKETQYSDSHPMKKLIVSAALLLLTITSMMASNPSGTPDAPALPEHHQAVADADYQVYSGEIDEQVFVMKIWKRGNEVTGHYYQAKSAKMMRLTGDHDPETGWITLRESYEGNTTGWWEFIANEDQISGAWSKSIDLLGAKAFSASSLGLDYDPDELMTESVSGTYVINDNTLKIQYVGGDQFSFHYQVKGVYGYSGSVNGIANMWDDSFAVYKDGKSCTLSFEFKDGKVIIDEETCKDYRGTLAYFSGELALASR